MKSPGPSRPISRSAPTSGPEWREAAQGARRSSGRWSRPTSSAITTTAAIPAISILSSSSSSPAARFSIRNGCTGFSTTTFRKSIRFSILKKIGCYNWGFVAGKYQTYEPWEAIWATIEQGGGKDYDMTKWQHDLFRPSLRPYDPKEIELIKRYNEKADARFKSGLDKKLFGTH